MLNIKKSPNELITTKHAITARNSRASVYQNLRVSESGLSLFSKIGSGS